MDTGYTTISRSYSWWQLFYVLFHSGSKSEKRVPPFKGKAVDKMPLKICNNCAEHCIAFYVLNHYCGVEGKKYVARSARTWTV